MAVGAGDEAYDDDMALWIQEYSGDKLKRKLGGEYGGETIYFVKLPHKWVGTSR